MDPARSWGAVALLCLLLSGGELGGSPPSPATTGTPPPFPLAPAHPVPCRVSIAPEEPTVEWGSSLLLNCTSSCRNYSRLSWEVSISKVGARGAGWVSLLIPNVTDWTLELQCFGNFGDRRDIAATTLRAYRFSRPPRISLEGEVVAGKETVVTCDAFAQVAPPGPPNLLLTLRVEGLPPSAHPGPTTRWVFRATPEQHGREVTCEATLRLGRRTLGAGAAVTLWVWAAPHHVQAWASRTRFAAGDNLTVTCRAEGNPPPRFRWELPSDASAELLDNGTAVVISAARRAHGGTYRCLVRNRYGTGAAAVDVLFNESSRNPLIPVAVTLAVVIGLTALAGSWWFYRSRGWKPMAGGSQPA